MTGMFRWLLFLRMAVHFNCLLSCPWALIHVYGLMSLNSGQRLSQTNRFLFVTGYSVLLLLEPVRLAVAHFGLVFRRPQLLMASWLLTTLIHCPIQTALLLLPSPALIGLVFDSLVLFLLFFQSVCGLFAVRKEILRLMRTRVASKGQHEEQLTTEL